MPTHRESGLRQAPPPQFFMNLADLGFWLNSAQSEKALARLSAMDDVEHGMERLYGERPDPWAATCQRYRYQRLKYERLAALIPDRPYAQVLDLGCGVGAFTRVLAPLVGTIVGVELSAQGVQQAEALSHEHANTRFRQGNVLDLDHAGLGATNDLVVLADVLYYLSPLSAAVLDGVCASVAELMAPAGVLLLANHCVGLWDRESQRTRLIHSRFVCSGAFRVLRQTWRPFYMATVLERREE